MATKTTTNATQDASGLTLESKVEGGRDVHTILNFLDGTVDLGWPSVPSE